MKIQIITFSLLFAAVAVMAQTPEPMKMKPEMTEIWDPEIAVVTPGETPNPSGLLPTVVLQLKKGQEPLKQNVNSKITSCILSGALQPKLLAKARDAETAVFLCREFMKCRFWTISIAVLTVTDKLEVFTNNIHRL